MAQQILNVGNPNASDGDPVRSAMIKVNDNFTEVYTNVTSLAATVGNQSSGISSISGQVSNNTTNINNLSGVVAAQATGLAGVNANIATLTGQVATAESDINTLQDQVAGLLYTPMQITSFTNTVGTVEIGSTVNSITFNWAVNKTPATLSINQGIGAITPPTATMLTVSVNITSDTTYTLTANDGTSYPQNVDTATTTVSFRHKVYWGTSASTSLNSAGILGLASSAFSTTRVRSFTIDGNGQYIYYAYPASFGDATFTVNGLLSTAWTKTVITFVNASGNSTSFNVYRSNTIQNGTGIQITVS